MTKLTEHFSMSEMTRSETAARRGIKNAPPASLMPNMMLSCERMEIVRRLCGNRPITVFSCFRSPALNAAVGGSKNSDHMKALAVDFKVSGMSIGDTIAVLRNSRELEYDQLIDEFNGWVHIGFGKRNRRQVLEARRSKAGTVYRQI